MNERIEDNFKRIESICEQEISLFYKPIIKGNLNEIKRYIENRQTEIEKLKQSKIRQLERYKKYKENIDNQHEKIYEDLVEEIEFKDKIIDLMEDEINKILKDSFERIGLDVYLEKENITVREFIERKVEND